MENCLVQNACKSFRSTRLHEHFRNWSLNVGCAKLAHMVQVRCTKLHNFSICGSGVEASEKHHEHEHDIDK